MAHLDLGPFIIECDGTSLTCGSDVLSVADVNIDANGRAHLAFPASGVAVCLLAEEWGTLLGEKSVVEEVAEVVAASEETTAPEVAVTPVVKKGRRKSS